MTEPPVSTTRLDPTGVLPPDVLDLAVPVELDELQPWHRPRKQFVREQQWVYFARRLIQRERDSPGLVVPPQGLPDVRYMTLPGTDYLDVRLLADVCSDLDCSLTSTGFLSGGEGNPHIARAKVREASLVRTGLITDASHTFRERVEEITPLTGPVYQLLGRRGPFHIINLDACGSMAGPNAEHSRRLIEAIHRILEFQFNNKRGRWLLFLTSDARPDSIEATTLCRLCDAVIDNARDDAEFQQRLVQLFGRQDAPVDTIVRRARESSGHTFLTIFALSLAKWFVHFADSKNWDTKTHTAYCYSTTHSDSDPPTLVSLAFEFSPRQVGLKDRFRVSRAEPAEARRLQNTSVRAIDKISDMTNLDDRMRACHALRERLRARTKDLLTEAGYSAAALSALGA